MLNFEQLASDSENYLKAYYAYKAQVELHNDFQVNSWRIPSQTQLKTKEYEMQLQTELLYRKLAKASETVDYIYEFNLNAKSFYPFKKQDQVAVLEFPQARSSESEKFPESPDLPRAKRSSSEKPTFDSKSSVKPENSASPHSSFLNQLEIPAQETFDLALQKGEAGPELSQKQLKKNSLQNEKHAAFLLCAELVKMAKKSRKEVEKFVGIR